MDGHLSAAKHAFIAMVATAAAFVYLAFGETQRNGNFETKSELSLVLAARDIAAGMYKPHQATNREISAFSDSLATQYNDLFIDGLKRRLSSGTSAAIPELTEISRRFGDIPNDVGEIINDIPMPYASTKKCDALLIRPDDYFFFDNINYLYYFDWSEIYSRNVRYLIFDNACQDGRHSRFFALIIPAKSGVISIALPQPSLDLFPEIVLWGEYPEQFMSKEDRARLLPPRVKKYFPMDDLVSVDVRAIEIMSIRLLGTIDGKAYTVNELSKSLLNIYDKDRSKTSLGGIDFDSLDFLRIVPLWMFAVSYYYWRQLRALSLVNLEGQTWTPLDTDDVVGLWVAYLWAFTPLIATASVYLMYPSAFGAVQVIFGYEVSPLGIWKWEFPEAVGLGWYGSDKIALATFALVVLQAVMIYICTASSLRLIGRYQKVSMRTPMANTFRRGRASIRRWLRKFRPNFREQ
ncbi:hypothetical protein NKI34_15675 [Mesorhizobium sp. M0700]|uniref:hypothetical protein n=1 Tax=Mesorhizobium sp. M0700 TaxID=2956988 RepID=UPI003334A7CC